MRGCVFIKLGAGLTNSICETCYRIYHHGEDPYLKSYKHCILAKIITPPVSRKICRCKNVPYFDSSGRSRSLFPIDLKSEHIKVVGKQCGLLKLPELVALAKYDGMQTILGKGRGPDNMKKNRKDEKNDIKTTIKKNARKDITQNKGPLKKIFGSSLIDTKKRGHRIRRSKG